MQANRSAVWTAVHMAHRHRSQAVVIRNAAFRERAALVLQTVVDTRPDVDHLRSLAEVVEEIKAQELEPAEAVAVIRARTAFARLAGILPETKAEFYGLLEVLIAALALIVAIVGSPRQDEQAPTITPEQVEEIIQRVVENVEDDAEPAPPTSSGTPTPTSTATPSATGEGHC
ncbi:hypothetical protein [Phytohabitans aurantiacus]|uniref:hypothetical protein n=1 Tax=Phytohabitans aurantiacus TaxID=3016789 RepID=UPI002490D99E|nr:hypothetical protein [Phytohabitans aurantiacus]